MQGPRQDSGSAGAKKFGCLGERKHPWQITISEEVCVSVICVCVRGEWGGMSMPLCRGS